MEVDAGLWALMVCIVGFVTVGCFMTASNLASQNLPHPARERPADNRH